jgi:hypothetical protein
MRNGEQLGTISIVEFGRNFSKGSCQLAGIFHEAALSAVYRRGDDAELRTASTIVQDYLDGKDVDEALLWKHICSHFGQPNEELELILFRNTKRADFMYKSYMSRKLSGTGIPCFCVPYHDYIMAVIAYSGEAQFLMQARELLSGDEYSCGVSLTFSSAKTMRNAVSQAILAIKIGDKEPCAINKCVDYAYAYLVSQLAEGGGVGTGLLHPALTMLKKYDEKHQSALYSTLYEYLRLERNVVATAKHMFIHRNSMVYRLQRLGKLLGLDLDDVNVRMYLLLSYHIDMAHGEDMQ